MRVFVTGGAGFIGSCVCELLLHQGAEVVAFDDFFTDRFVLPETNQSLALSATVEAYWVDQD